LSMKLSASRPGHVDPCAYPPRGLCREEAALKSSEDFGTYCNVGLIHALPPEARRCFDRKEAASYVGVSPTTFDKLVRQGTMPRPTVFLGRKVWDRLAIDRLLDAESGIESRGGQVANGFDDDLDRELAAFETKHGQH
jgi:excisionase family DNA binding protein